MSLFLVPLMFLTTFLSSFLLWTLIPNITPLCCICNLLDCKFNKLCYLGLVFSRDNWVVVVSSKNNVQFDGFQSMAISFIPLWCHCHMNIPKNNFLLIIDFHPNIIKPIHIWISHKHSQNYVFQLCFCHPILLNYINKKEVINL